MRHRHSSTHAPQAFGINRNAGDKSRVEPHPSPTATGMTLERIKEAVAQRFPVAAPALGVLSPDRLKAKEAAQRAQGELDKHDVLINHRIWKVETVKDPTVDRPAAFEELCTRERAERRAFLAGIAALMAAIVSVYAPFLAGVSADPWGVFRLIAAPVCVALVVITTRNCQTAQRALTVADDVLRRTIQTRSDVYAAYTRFTRFVEAFHATEPPVPLLSAIVEREAYAVEILVEVDRLIDRNHADAPQVDELSRAMARLAVEMDALVREAEERHRVITDAGVEAELLLARAPESLMPAVGEVTDQTNFIRSLMSTDDIDRALATGTRLGSTDKVNPT